MFDFVFLEKGLERIANVKLINLIGTSAIFY